MARAGRAYARDPVHLTAGRRTVTPTSRQTAGILAIERAAATSAPRLGVDAGRVERLVAALARTMDREPANARIRAPARPAVVLDTQGDVRWRPRQADVRITPSAAGRRLRRPEAVASISAAVRAGLHSAAVTFTRSPARVRTRAARAVTSLLGTFTTRYPCCQPRVTNIRLIAKDVDATVVLPGERFSLNEATGERRRADGYVAAPFIADGKIVPSVGGGVSQFSTTLYNAAYFAGLRIDAHQPHSFYIERYPAGREATLNFPDIDLRWTNDTPSPVLIRSSTDATSVVVSLYGADDGRRVRAQAGERQSLDAGDFQITVTRLLRTADRRLVRQPYTTRYDRPPPPE